MSPLRRSAFALALAPWLITTAAHAAEPGLQPEAMAALKRMGTYLRSLEAYRVQTTTTSEAVLLDGQKIQSENSIDSLVKAPDRLRIHTSNDRAERLYF